MDAFRALQKQNHPDGSPGRHGSRKYGCPCCQPYSLPKMKRLSRTDAKRKFRQETRKEIEGEVTSYKDHDR